jgi:hypothetical protein
MHDDLPGYDVLAARLQGVCDCGHWINDHEMGVNPPTMLNRCIAAGCECALFAFSIDLSHPLRVAQREDDPSRWPAYVDRYFADQLFQPEE